MAAFAIALVAVGPAAAEPPAGSEATASKAKKGKKAKLRVKVLTTGQKAVLRKGVKVRVRGRPRSRVRLDTVARWFDGSSRLSASRRVRLGRKGKRIVRLRLVPTASRAAGGCSALELIAKARSGRQAARSSRDMVRQKARCLPDRIDLSSKEDCEFIAQPKHGMCMLPFPSDFYTVPDPDSPTGKRISFSEDGMPENASGVGIAPDAYAGSDGFSQGQGIVLKVPGLDTPEAVSANDFVPLKRLSRFSERDQKAVVIDAETGKRWPIWVETDANASTPEAAALLITPAVNFDEKGRYIVALRNLVDADGKPIEAPDAFRYYRDEIPSNQSAINQRRDHFEGIFRTLRRAKVKRSELYLAWDFTVASNENNYRRALHMRDEAFEALGDTTMADQIVQGEAPAFEIDEVTDIDGPQIKRRVRGTYTVPCFLSPDCEPGGTMDLDATGLPQRNGNYEANFTCVVPQVGLSGPNPPKLRPFVFGHGLLGAADQVQGSINPDLAQDHSMIACATDEIGMANEDLPQVILALGELSRFSVVPDRLQQGLLNGLFLARLMFHPDGFGTHPAFQDGDGAVPGESVIRTDHVYYMGASQGGIMGGALTAIAPDFIQSALVVGGMNYSTLLTRSSNWPTYSAFLGGAYPEELSHPLLLNLIQMLWDRGEPNGYAHVMTDEPPPNTPGHNVTLHVAVGDHQVSNFASDVQARTVGMKTNAGAIDTERWPDYEGLWNVPRIEADEYPYRGSSIVYWDGGPYRLNPSDLSQDIGTDPPPYANVPPNPQWEDPHGAPRGADGPVEMIGTFFQPDGYIEDVCGGQPCRSDDWDGDLGSIIPVP